MLVCEFIHMYVINERILTLPGNLRNLNDKTRYSIMPTFMR